MRSLSQHLGISILLPSYLVVASLADAAEPTALASPSSAPTNEQLAEQFLKANEFVSAALQAEADGEFLERQRFINSAAAYAPDTPRLRWQQGYVLDGQSGWISIDECIRIAQSDKRLTEYQQRRNQLQDLPENHLQLAAWCAQQQLFLQARSHYERVLQFDPDHVPARLALGYQWAGGDWISPARILEMQRRGERAQASVGVFGPALLEIANGLSHKKAAQREAAKQQLWDLKDADAVPAVECLFGGANEQLSGIVIDWLSERDTVESSQVLMRYACLHFSPAIREKAALALKSRPLLDFVPDMLAILGSPIQSILVPQLNRAGKLVGYSQAFAQEKQDQRNVVAFNTEIARVPLILASESDLSNPSPGMWRVTSPAFVPENFVVENQMRAAAQIEITTRAALAAHENQSIVIVNDRIADVLTTITNIEFTGDAQQMWTWWDKHNETEYQNYKADRYRERNVRYSIPEYSRADFEESPPLPPPPVRAPSRPRSTLRSGFVGGDCLTAGTPVLTVQGLRPIESIVAGDLVFGRDLHSGALLIKPVLAATRRPPSDTVQLTIDGRTLSCSNGHTLWVSGEGWKRASQIAVGDVLHTSGDPVVVTEVKKMPPTVTYNISVADTNNLFVGESQILSCDVTPRAASRVRVPGLAAAR